MTYKPPVAVYDACVLYPFHLRNLLVQCAVDRLVDARWSQEIHDEWIRNLAAHRPELSVERLTRTRDLMDRVLPDANVTGHMVHVPTITLPDPDDRHVVAAAIEAKASAIVTWNLRDFPAAALRPFGLHRISPDAFLMDLYDAAPDLVIAAVTSARANLRESAGTAAAFIEALRRQKLKRFADAVSSQIGEL
jgi:predicted nucleic acid-binding protein